jgi:hypothetical protein
LKRDKGTRSVSMKLVKRSNIRPVPLGATKSTSTLVDLRRVTLSSDHRTITRCQLLFVTGFCGSNTE